MVLLLLLRTHMWVWLCVCRCKARQWHIGVRRRGPFGSSRAMCGASAGKPWPTTQRAVLGISYLPYLLGECISPVRAAAYAYGLCTAGAVIATTDGAESMAWHACPQADPASSLLAAVRKAQHNIKHLAVCGLINVVWVWFGVTWPVALRFLTERGFRADVAACRHCFPGMLTFKVRDQHPPGTQCTG